MNSQSSDDNASCILENVPNEATSNILQQVLKRLFGKNSLLCGCLKESRSLSYSFYGADALTSVCIVDQIEDPDIVKYREKSCQLELNKNGKRFYLDWRLFKDAGEVNELIKELIKMSTKFNYDVDQPNLRFVLYGSEFSLRLFIFKLTERKLNECLPIFTPFVDKTLSNDERLDRWLRKHFELFVKNAKKESKIWFTQKTFLQRQFENELKGVDKEKLKHLLKVKKSNDENFDNDYRQVYKDAFNNNKDLWEYFDFLFEDDGDDSKRKFNVMGFLKRQQDADNLFSNLSENTTFEELVECLFAEENIILQKTSAEKKKRLNEYWISSSHNSYLLGRQWFGDSAALAYAQILLSGCRCVELDLWPKKDKICVTHSTTLTTCVPLETILLTIKKYAFCKTECPLILSLEDHCSYNQQAEMAEMFKKYLGELLVTEELFPDKKMPTLEQLRRRILLKHNVLDYTPYEKFKSELNKIVWQKEIWVKYALNDKWRKKHGILYNNRLHVKNASEIKALKTDQLISGSQVRPPSPPELLDIFNHGLQFSEYQKPAEPNQSDQPDQPESSKQTEHFEQKKALETKLKVFENVYIKSTNNMIFAKIGEEEIKQNFNIVCPSPYEYFQQHKEVEQCIQKGNFEEAIKMLTSSIDRNNLNDKEYFDYIYEFKIYCYWKSNLQDKYEQMLKCTNEAIDYNSINTKFYLFRALIFCYLKNYNDAMLDLQKVLDLEPKTAFAKKLILSIQTTIGPYSELLISASKALQSEFFEEALKCYDAAIELESKGHKNHILLGQLWYLKAICFQALRKYNKMLQAAVKSIKYDPDEKLSVVISAVANFFLGKYDESLRDADCVFCLDSKEEQEKQETILESNTGSSTILSSDDGETEDVLKDCTVKQEETEPTPSTSTASKQQVNEFKNVFDLKNIAFGKALWTPKQYEILAYINKGVIGTIWKAFDTIKEEQVAIKHITVKSDNINTLKCMYREFKILNSANHKNITSLLTVYSPGVAITDFAQFKEIYFVLPYVETTLSKLIANSYATVSFDQKTFIVYQLLCGLDYLHKNNIYYRNLIPHNISVDKGFNVKIMSFSFASLICEELEPFALLDAYKAPEILCRKTLYDCKVDLWSLGCIFIEIFTGKRIVHRFSTQLTAGHWFIVIKMLGIQPGDSFFQDMSRCSYSKINKQNESAAWDEILPTTCFMEAFQNSEECVKNAKLAQNLLSKMLQICPDLRCTAEDAMKHPFLSKWYDSADLNAGGQTTFYKPDVDKISDPLKLKKLLYEEVKTYMEENDVLRIQSAKLNIANEQTDQNNLQIIDDQRLINTAYNWFFVGMSRIKAHVLLANVSEEGIFLVRTNEEEYPNGCILSIRLCNCVRHYRLKDENGRYIFNGAEFGKLNKLFKYSQISCGDSFQMNPIYIKPGDMEMADETLKQIDTQLFDTSDDYENMISMRSFKEFSVETYLKYPSKLVFAIPAYSIFYICNENMNPVKIEYNGFRYFADEKKVKQSAIKFDPNNDHVFLLNETITQNLSLNEYFLFDLVFKEDNPYGRIRFGSEIEQDCNKWMKRINIQIKKINDAKSVPKPSKGTNSIHEKMSKLTVYFKTYSFDDLNAETDYIHYYNKVCSINEQKFEALNKIDPMNRFNSKKMSRVYPHYTRIESDNYDPLPCWNAGCQMVALNYQDDGKEMLLNYGRFLANGNCGYVPKPYLITRKVLLSDRNARPKLLTISIIGGRNLKRLFSHSSGICSPMIEVWIAGHERDKQYQKTKAVRLNGLNPVWKDGQFNFPIYYPELDFLCFRVIDADYIGFINKNYFVDPSKNQSIGQAAFSLNCLRLGYRSIPLLNNYNQPLEMSSLLVNVINLPYKQNRH